MFAPAFKHNINLITKPDLKWIVENKASHWVKISYMSARKRLFVNPTIIPPQSKDNLKFKNVQIRYIYASHLN